ncbi:MAG: integrase zinc binding domain-containing protein, partial [Sedimenticola sp.]
NTTVSQEGSSNEGSDLGPIHDTSPETNSLCMENIALVQSSDPVLSYLKVWKSDGRKPDWSEVASHSKELKYYWHRWDSLSLQDGVLYRLWESDNGNTVDNQVVVPKSLRKEVFLQLHNSITAGHFGVKNTLAKVRHRFHWYGLRKDVTYWCKQCDTCASRKTPHRKAKSPMKIYNVGQPLERIAVDIQGPYPITHKGNHYIMVVGDCFTKWLQAIPLQTQEAHHVAT